MNSCYCPSCQQTFSSDLAWCAHKPWVSRWRRGRCRFGNNLYESQDGWNLRPQWVKAVRSAEEGPPDSYRILDPKTA